MLNTIFITDYKEKKFLLKDRQIMFAKESSSKTRESDLLCLDDDIHFQEILGFGGAMTQSSASILMKLPVTVRNNIMRDYFDKNEGIGYSFCRSTINSCDFSENSYSYDDTPGDRDLSDFSIERDENDVLPILLMAQSIAPELKWFSSPWSPPFWMKTNHDMCHGGMLAAGYEQIWANYLALFVRTYRRRGVRLWGITLQNEENAEMGWESCYWNKERMAEFIAKNVSKAFSGSDISDTKIFYWDHNKDRIVEHAKAVIKQKGANEVIAGTAFHWYVPDHFGALDSVHQLMPDKYLIATEACLGKRTAAEYDSGEKYAHDIIGDLNHWANSWTDWNMILDSEGKPDHWLDEQRKFVKQFTTNKLKESDLTGTQRKFLYQFVNGTPIWIGEAPIMIDENQKIKKNSSYYYLGHFSKFIRPGARRISCSIYGPDLEACAIQNKDGSIVTVVLNRTDEPHDVCILLHECTSEFKIGSHSIITSIIK